MKNVFMGFDSTYAWPQKTTNNSFLVSTATNEALTANLGVPTCLNNSAVQIVCLAIPCDYRKLATTKVIKT